MRRVYFPPIPCRCQRRAPFAIGCCCSSSLWSCRLCSFAVLVEWCGLIANTFPPECRAILGNRWNDASHWNGSSWKPDYSILLLLCKGKNKLCYCPGKSAAAALTCKQYTIPFRRQFCAVRTRWSQYSGPHSRTWQRLPWLTSAAIDSVPPNDEAKKSLGTIIKFRAFYTRARACGLRRGVWCIQQIIIMHFLGHRFTVFVLYCTQIPFQLNTNKKMQSDWSAPPAHTHTCTADSKISLSWPMDDDDVVMSTLSNKGGWFGSPIFALHQPRRRRRRGGKSAINRKKLLQFDSFSLHKIRTQTHTDGRVNEEQQKKNTDAITQQSVPQKKKTNSLFCCTHK